MRMVAANGLVVSLLAIAHGSSGEVPGHDQPSVEVCRVEPVLLSLPDLPEASGVAVGRRMPRRLWMHNDSAEPVVLGLDLDGSVRQRVRVTGAEVEDWEDIAMGPCPDGACLYIADIGDNDTNRSHITIYRVPEPAGAETQTRAAEVFRATYPDGPHDAEAILVTPDGRLLIATKERSGAIYRLPLPLRSGTTATLERLLVLDDDEPRRAGGGRAPRITGGSVSPDGTWMALRSNSTLAFFRSRDIAAGRSGQPIRVDLSDLDEAQGEGVALGDDGVVYLVSEGGKKDRPGTLRRLTCRLPR